MASILQVEQIQGPTSGASANTIQIPSGQTLDINGTLSGDGSSLTGMNIGYGTFQANFTSEITISHATWTKIAFNTSVIDTDSLYDTSNYRYTPQVAGVYYINSFVQIQGWISTSSACLMEIRKNGSRHKQHIHVPNTSEYPTVETTALVDMNGTTDYIEIYIYQSSGGSKDIFANRESSFEGYLVRAT